MNHMVLMPVYLLVLGLQLASIIISKWGSTSGRTKLPAGGADMDYTITMGLWKMCGDITFSSDGKTKNTSSCGSIPGSTYSSSQKNSLNAVRAMSILGALLSALGLILALTGRCTKGIMASCLIGGGVCTLIGAGIWYETQRVYPESALMGVPAFTAASGLGMYMAITAGAISVLGGGMCLVAKS